MTREQTLNQVAAQAVTTYEFSCCWAETARRVAEDLREEGIQPTRATVLHVINLAKLKWQALSMRVKAEIGE
jgi:hypothetical protein